MTGLEWRRRRRTPGKYGRGAVLILAIAILLGPGFLAAQQRVPAEVQAIKSAVRAAGGRAIVQVRPAQGARLQANGRSNMSEQAVAAIQRNLERQGLRRAWRVGLVPLVFGEVDDAGIDALLADPEVLAIEPDVAMPLAVVRSEARPIRSIAAETTPWGISRVTAPEAWALQSPALDGTGVRIAFLDSGGDMDHPDLVWAGGFNAITSSTSPAAWDDDLSVCGGHGTHVAGTLAATRNTVGVVGVAPGAALYAIKVFENVNGSCLAYVSRQIAGLNWAVQQGVRVVSVSIGGSTYVSSYEQAINAAMAAGTYVVAAAGNNGSTSITYPGNYPNALTVAALTSSNTRSSYSNYGPKIFLAAPGDGIQSTMPGGGYGSKSGTSMATPHVAGVVALLLAHDPGASRTEILARLQAGALDLGAAGKDDLTGYGLARASESIQAAGATPSPVPLVLAVSPTSRRAATVVGSTAAIGDSGAVSLTGDNSAAAAWSATRRKSWTTLIAASGTGSGTVRWTRNPTGLAAGTYVDTIAVAAPGASGSPGRIIDTLVVAPAPVPLALAVSPGGRRAEVLVGATATVADSAAVALTGDPATTTGWSATRRRSWNTLTVASGTGSGTLRWSRNPAGLLAGVHVDTITVSAGGLTARVIDSLVVTSVATPLVLTVTPTGRRNAVKAGTTALLADTGAVTLTGTGAASATWSASRRSSWLSIQTVGGTGSGPLRWTRNPAGLAEGTYVDTITVVSAGALQSPSRIIDTLVITAARTKGGATTKPAGGKKTASSTSTSEAAEVVHDSLQVEVEGELPAALAWTATTDAPWIHLLRGNGAGTEAVAWRRDASGMPAGLHVGRLTIRIMVDGEAIEAVFADTLIAGVDDPAVVAAAEELFSPNRLTSHQRILLDQLGNRNGVYDLGDFLAWIERTGTAPPAAVMERLMTLPPASGTAARVRPNPGGSQ